MKKALVTLLFFVLAFCLSYVCVAHMANPPVQPFMYRNHAFLGTDMGVIHDPDCICTIKSFVFKIKTKSGSIIGNIHIQAKNAEAAKYKLKQKYPNCEIMEMEEK